MEIVNIIILEANDMFCNYNTEKLLGLKEIIVKNVRQLPDRMEILIEMPKEPHVCPCCGHKTNYVHDYRQLSKMPYMSSKNITLYARSSGLLKPFERKNRKSPAKLEELTLSAPDPY